MSITRITISGTPGSGKTSLAEFLSRKLKLRFYSVGEFARKIALKRKVTIDKLSELALKDKKIDKEIDYVHKKLRGSFVIDSRIAFHFFPSSVKIFLYCKPEIAARRIFLARRKTEKLSLNATLNEVRRREKLDVLRYKKNYGIDISNLKNYDLVLDTSSLSKQEVNKAILRALQEFYQ